MNIDKTVGLTLTPEPRPAAWVAAAYRGDQPTWRPVWDLAGPARSRCVWLRPHEAKGRALGIQSGPAAQPKHDWEELAGKVFSQLSQWQRMDLASYGMDERQYILGTYVMSNVWFTVYYRPPDMATVKLLDAAQTKILWKSRLDNTGSRVNQFSPLHHFRVGHRLKRDSLQMDRHHGGKRFFTTRNVVDSILASFVLHVLYPHDANTPASGSMSWQTTGRCTIAAALGSIAGALCHPNIGTAVRGRRRRVSARWQAYLTGFAKVRTSYALTPPTTFEEVQSIPIYDNTEVGNGRNLPAHEWTVASDAGVTVVGDLWDTRTGDFHTAASLRLTARRRQRLIAAIPAAWADTLRRGRRPITPGEWALAPLMPGLAGHPRYGTLVEIQATIHSTATVIAYEVMTCGGWRAAGVRHLQLQDLRRATMEPGRKQIHGIGELVTLHGLTSTDFASCRARLTWRNRTAITFNVKTGCEMLRGDSKMTDELTTLRAAIPPPRHAAGFADIRAAAWLPKTRDFAWCLRADGVRAEWSVSDRLVVLRH